MEQIINYVKPELLTVAIALYFIGKGLKQSKTVHDESIPMALGCIGVILCSIWVIATSVITNYQDIAMAVFTAIIQGILVAGLSVYVDQLVKQRHKEV